MRRLVLIPARNEAASLPLVVGELRRQDPALPILVVDDASEDETPFVLSRLGVSWLRLSERLGIGGAMRTGLRWARRAGHDAVVRIDGDGQHDPVHLPALLEPIRTGHAEAVQGSRYREGGEPATASLRRASQHLLAGLLSTLTQDTVTDPTSGLWAFGPRAIRVLADHHPTGYPEPELRLWLARNRFRTAEVPVKMRPRQAGRTSLDMPAMGLALGRVLLAMAVVPLRDHVEVSALD